MRVWVVLLTALTLCGCQSINDTRKSGINLTFESKKNVDDVSQCILYKWQNKKDIFGVPFGAYIQPLPNGKTVFVDGNLFIADITKENKNTTTVNLYLTNAKNGWTEITKSCL